MGLFGEIDHVSIVVRDLPGAVEYYRDTFGCELTDERVGNDTVEAFLKVAESFVRLVQPTSQVGRAQQFLTEHGEGVMAIGFRVADCTLALEGLKLLGNEVIDDVPVLHDDGSQTARIVPKQGSGVIIELVQRPRENSPG